MKKIYLIPILLLFITSLSVASERQSIINLIPKQPDYSISPAVNYIYITSGINMSLAKHLSKRLLFAKEGEVIHLNVTSPGGSRAAMQLILDAMENTKAKIVYHVPSAVYSAAAIMMCYADKVRINDNAIVMFHTAQVKQGPEPLTTNRNLILKKIFEYTQRIYKKCQPFLTKEQMNRILINGEDLFLLGYEINKKLDKNKKL